MESTDEKHIQRINELIFDDNTIVTCTSLSKILKIKVSEAQNLLDKYVEDIDSLKKDFSCTYILIGINAEDIFSVTIAKQNDLENKKNTLKTVVSQHVYSVQKTKDIDLTVLANVEPLTEGSIKNEPLLGSVVSNNATKRKLKKIPKNSVNNMKQEKQAPEVKQEKFENKENKNKLKKSSIGNFLTQGNIETSKSNFKPKIEGKAKQKNMMANFFSKTSSTNDKTNGQVKEKTIDNEIQQEVNIGNELGEDTNDGSQQETENEIRNEEAMDVENREPVTNQEETVNSSVSKTKQDTPKRSKKNKKRKTDGKSDQPSKKRKRIVEARNSDSDIFASSEESEIEVVPDLNYFEDFVEEKQTDPSVPSKTRRMKQVTEEFMDEDGYMNTVSKYVMISDEEEEDKEQKPLNVIPEKTDVPPVVKNKHAASALSQKDNSPKKSKNAKGKGGKVSQNQTSIMSFFKKT